MKNFFYTLCFSFLFFSSSAITPQNLLTDTTSVCSGQSVTLSVSAALIGSNTFVWSTSQTTLSIIVSTLVSAQYSITVTDGIDSYTDQTWVKILPAPSVSVSADATSLSECSINNIYKNRVYTVVRTTLNVQYGQNNLFNGSNQNLLLDIYEPEAQVNYLRPLIIFAHGGGFTSGSKSAVNQTAFADSMARRGYIVACIDYRLGVSGAQTKTEYEVSIYRAAQDMNCAIRFFRKNSLQYKVDTSQIFLGGTSAGAVTAMYAAYWNKAEFPPSIDTTVLGNLWNGGGNSGYSTNPKGVLCFWGGVIDTNIFLNNLTPPINEFQTINDPTIPYTSGLYLNKFTIYGCYTINRVATNQGIESHLAPYNISGHGVSPGTVYWDSCMRHMIRFTYNHLTTPVNKKAIFSLTASGDAINYSWAPSIGLSATSGLNVFASPTSTTTYTVTGVGANGCSSSATIVLNIVPKYTLTITPSAPSICFGSSVNLSVTGASSYQWSPTIALTSTTSSSTIANPTSTITYSVTGYDALGCTGKKSVVVIVNPLPVPSVISAGGPTTFCAGNNVLLSGNSTGGTWSVGGSTATSVSVSTSGDYFTTTTNSCGSTTSNHISVTVNPLPIASVISAGGPTTFCSGNNVLLSGNTTGGTWSIGGASSSSLSATQAGDYFTTTSNACGTTTSNHISVTVNSLPSLSISGLQNSYCVDGSSSSITLNPIGGILTGQGINGSNFSPASVTTLNQSISVLYNYTDANNCSNSTSASTIVHSLPTVQLTSNYPSVCIGGSATITASGASNYTWNYSNASVTTQNTASAVVVPQANSLISVSGTDANGCSASKSISIGVYTVPPVLLSADHTSVCEGSAATVTASGASTYNWSISNASVITQNPDNATLIPQTNSSIQVIGTDASGCSSSNSISISIHALPSVGVSSNNTSVCQGNSATITGSGANNYSWSLTNASLVTQNTDNVIVIPQTNSFIQVTGTDANGCSASNSISVGVNVPPTVTVYSDKNSVCPGETVTLTSDGAATYSWTYTNATLVSQTGNQLVIISNPNSDVTVTGTDALGCSATASKTISNSGSTPTKPNFNNSMAWVCLNQNGVVYSVTPVAGATSYTWTASSGATIASGQGTNSITVNFSASAVAGSISVFATNNCGNSQSNSFAYSIATAKPGTPGAISGAGIACPSTSVTYSIVAVAKATSYTWTIPTNTTIVSGQGTSSILLSFNANWTSGNVSVKASNCFGISAARTKTLTGKPSIPASISGTTSGVCAGTTGLIYSTPAVTGASSYTWTAPTNATIVSGQGTVSVTINYNATFTTGTLSVSANNACGSSGLRSATILSTPNIPASISGPGFNMCNTVNQNYYVTADPVATSFTWTVPANMSITSGQGTNSILVSTTGSFISGAIKVIANNTCGSSGQRSITVYAKPALPGVISGNASVCAHDTGKIYSIVAVTGATSYTWTVPTGATIVSGQGTTSIKVTYGTAGGSITVKASNACAVSNTRSFTVSMTCKSEFETVKSTFVIYPNPTTGKFNVEFSEAESGVLTVTDLLGRIIYQLRLSEILSSEINLNNEAAGMYLVEWQTADKIELKKVVVER